MRRSCETVQDWAVRVSLLIGLIGKKRSGKDTFARALSPLGIQRFAFADPLREALLTLNPIIFGYDDFASPPMEGDTRLADLINEYGWEVAKDQFSEVRYLMQNYGVGIRKIDPDFWLRATSQQVDAARFQQGHDCVITDVRFPNEAEWIKAAGGVLVRLYRPGLADDGDRHESETALADWTEDHIVMNHSVQQLTYTARALAVALLTETKKQ
jgi:hypothetical protein